MEEMIADTTTQLDFKLEEKMRAWMEEPTIRLRETEVKDISVRAKVTKSNEKDKAETDGDCEKEDKCKPEG